MEGQGLVGSDLRADRIPKGTHRKRRSPRRCDPTSLRALDQRQAVEIRIVAKSVYLTGDQRENAFSKRIGHLANSVRVNKFDEGRNTKKFSCRQYQGFGWKESGNLGLNDYQR